MHVASLKSAVIEDLLANLLAGKIPNYPKCLDTERIISELAFGRFINL